MEFANKTGYVFVRTRAGVTRKVFEQVRANDWVIGAWAVTGDYDIVVWANARNEEELFTQAAILRNMAGVEYTNSRLVHSGFVADFKTFNSRNGAWVRLRADKLGPPPNFLRDLPYVGAYATIAGDYDYLVWAFGDDVHDAIEHVLAMTENRDWRTYTHVPILAYFNHKFDTTL
jgi:hypothetical protein